MSALRTISKYPNRRLYDPVQSRYITLADLRQLILERVDFVVIEKKTQSDITRSVLLQVIAEQERYEALLGSDFLLQIIRSHGSVNPGLLSSYLEQSLKLLLAANGAGSSPAAEAGYRGDKEAARILAQSTFQRWRAVQDEIYRALTDAAPRVRTAGTEQENLHP
jgi:polyhydroxyalkanoate synthesis repressor PhaR